jgi:hypothetical protein
LVCATGRAGGCSPEAVSYQPAKRLTHAGTGGPLVGYGLTSPTRCVNGKAGWYHSIWRVDAALGSYLSLTLTLSWP